MMKRLSYFALTALLTVGLSMPAWSQAPKKMDECASMKTAPKGETADAKKKRVADLKTCTDKQKADAKAMKQKAKPASTPKKGGK